MNFTHRLLALLAVFIWGTAGIAIKPAFDVLSPLFYAALAFSFAGIVLFIVVRPSLHYVKAVLPAAIFLGPFHNGLCLTGLQGLDVGVVCVGLQTQMIFAVLLASFFFKERISLRQYMGMGLAFFGIILFSGSPKVFEHIGAFLIVVLSAFFWGVANIFMKSIARVPAKDFITLYCLIAGLSFFPMSFFLEQGHLDMLSKVSFEVLGSVLYMGFMVTVLAYALWQYLISKYPVSAVTPYTLLVPIFGLFFSWLVRGETITLQQILGSAIVVMGLALIVLKFSQKKGAQFS